MAAERGGFATDFNMFTLPENAISDITGYAGETVADVWPIAALVLGVLLAIVIISHLWGGNDDHADDN